MLISMDEKLLSYRGFLQKTSEGKWVLCDAPHLKSCCMQQHILITLEGDFSRYSMEKAITIQGIYNPSENVLSQVSVQKEQKAFPCLTLGGIILLLVLWKLILRGRKGRPLLP